MQIEMRMWTTSLFVSLFALPLALCQSGSPSDVRLPPAFTIAPDLGNYYRNEDKFTLPCKAHGVPEVSYEWKRNGVDLNLNGYNVKRDVDGTITIDPATSLDAGFYQCIAKNQFGTALSNTSFMQLAVLGSGTTAIVTKIVTDGDPFCVEAHPTKSNPKPQSTWETATDAVDKFPVMVTLTKRIQIAENGDLCFAFSKPEDGLVGDRIYKRSEFNERTDTTTGGSYSKVTVVAAAPGGPKPFAPTLGFSSQQQTVAVEGRDVTLWCFFSGNPEPNHAWSGPKNVLPMGRYKASTYNTRLTITTIQPSDEGDYVCTAENGIGSKTNTLQLRVEALPKFLSTDDQPHDTNVTEGSSLTFKCYTYAKPAATVVWLKNGVPLDLNQLPKRYRISTDKKSLTIADVCRDCPDRPDSGQSDLGIIQCNASNIHGYAFGAGYVNVLLKTTVVVIGEKDVEVEINKEEEVTWDCKVTSDPSTPPKVKWFKVTKDGDEPVYNETQVVYLKDGTLKIHVVPNKTQGWEKFQGEYRCDGDNGYTKESVKVMLRIADYPMAGAGVAGIGTYWWIILLILLILLLILLICICCICMQRNKGDKYDVDEKERKNGNDPEKELVNNGFQDYQRPEGQNLRGSRGSLGSAGKLHSDDEASLMEFGDDPGKFTEDGSFVGAYASNTTDRTRGRRE